MAKETNTSSGKIGPVVTYQLYGKTVIRSKPCKYKRTESTKKRSANFGVAARASKTLRPMLSHVIPFPKDIFMQCRFVGAISKWLKTTALHDLVPQTKLPSITGFQFNNETSLNERLKIELELTKTGTNELRLHIPSFIPTLSFAAPAHTINVECRISAAGCMLSNGNATGNFETTIIIPFSAIPVPAQDIIITIPTPAGSILLTAMALLFHAKKKGVIAINDKAPFMPAGVINAMYC